MPGPGAKRVFHAVATALVLGGLLAAQPAGAVKAPRPSIAFVTSSQAHPESQAWVAAEGGVEPKRLGPGNDPLIDPLGRFVAAGLFGTGPETGPSLALYPLGAYPGPAGPPSTFGNLARQNATPLAWSPDGRYLAVALNSTAVKGVARKSGLGILDTTTGTLRTIATGIVYGASFAPDGSDRVVFGRAFSQNLAPVNLYVAAASGAGLRRLTSDGRSLNPVWGPKSIAYDRERLRRSDAPVYQVWLRGTGAGAPRRLTSIRVRSLVSGLMPLGFSADGTRLLTEFVGQDTSEAWTVEVASGRARPVRVKGRPVSGGAISRDGSRLLVTEGGQQGPADTGNVLTVPFAGGAPTLLVAHAAQPSWTE